MENTSLTPIDGTAALSPSASLEIEFARDRWDARNIPGLRYAPHRNAHYIIFTDVPDTFRPVVKEYVRFLLAAGRAAKTLAENAFYLGHFFAFFSQRYPARAHLRHFQKKMSMRTSSVSEPEQTLEDGRKPSSKFGRIYTTWRACSPISNASRVRLNPLSQHHASSGRIITHGESGRDPSKSSTFHKQCSTSLTPIFTTYQRCTFPL